MQIRSLVMSAVVSLAVACGGSHKPEATAGGGSAKSLYDRLGGQPAITAVVDDFVARTGSDPRIMRFFLSIDVPNIKAKMVTQICEGTGGPCKYNGKTMKAAHANMGVKDADFAAFIEDLTATLDKLHVPAQEKSEVLALFQSMKGDTVTP